MQLKETTNILDGFTDLEESFKTELHYIGTNATILLGLKEINTDFELFQTVALIVVDVFKIYYLAERLEGFLTSKPSIDKDTDFEFLKENIQSIINLIKNFNNSNVADNFKNPNHVFFIAKGRLTNSIEQLTYFLDRFKEVYDHYEGVDL